jgi:nucleoside-diphosphate-sugar epimerase
MRILYIGGTGEISHACVAASAALGQECLVFNRGRNDEPLPPGVRRIVGDLDDPAAYAALAGEHFDVVCQFLAYTPEQIRRDIEVFAGHCGQYVFISTASAYRKPPTTWRLTEDVPLSNPYWPYSQLKADMEKMLLAAHTAGRLPVTIVRPSHTYRRRFPGTFVSGDDHAWRMRQGRPVIVHGDGQSLWTYTHAADFAAPFARLLGRPEALGEAFHIMTDSVFTWDQLFTAVGAALGVEPELVHIPSETIVRYDPQWRGPLYGDKMWSTTFDTSKVQRLTGPPPTPLPLAEGFARVRPHFEARMRSFVPDEKLHALLDRMAREQRQCG